MKLRTLCLHLVPSLLVAVSGCSSSPSGNKDAAATGSGGSGSGSGGTTGSGGATGSGGSTGTGGSTGSGGATGSGGSTGTGGTTGSGGATGSGGTGGATGTGGTSGSDGGGSGGSAGSDGGSADGSASPMMNLFVTSDTRPNANLGGLAMADMRCQTLAAAVGQGGKTWKAYLSVATPLTHARDRIADGPYYNAAGAMVAATKDALHMRNGDPALFLTEKGQRVNGQWAQSPTPNQHDILTGTTREGMLATGLTCSDWTATTGMHQVGHSDGLGPNMDMAAPRSYWTGAHTASCANVLAAGGAAKTYCFVGAP